MSGPLFGVVVFPGSNCDQDCRWAIESVLGYRCEYVWHHDADLERFDCVVLPGGFSYGDHLRAGAIARFSPVMNAVCRYAENGGLVVGICNGFQILLEAGLLPGAMQKNDRLKFRCHPTYLRVEARTPFTLRYHPGQVVSIPIAHYEGNYFCRPSDLEELEANGQVAFRYVNADGQATRDANPNGSLNAIAGVTNRRGNVLGMMPHPERAAEPELGSADGRFLFASIADWLTGEANRRD